MLSRVVTTSLTRASPLICGSVRNVAHLAELPEEHEMLKQTCRSFANEVLAPNAGDWDKNHTFPAEAVRIDINHHVPSIQ
eukprot:m.90845 g.90845  ORF g.90845 m.90845 type:complete len:80 (+) comp14884_c0_seq44:2284-2523(+)